MDMLLSWPPSAPGKRKRDREISINTAVQRERKVAQRDRVSVRGNPDESKAASVLSLLTLVGTYYPSTGLDQNANNNNYYY